jgi:hypothetical protein
MARKDADKGARARKAEKMAAALEYKKAGATVRWIAERLDIGVATAHSYITQGIDELNKRGLQHAEEMRTLEGARIDQGRFAIYPKVVRGELEALDRWLKASGEYRKLYGLDKPAKLAFTDAEGEQPYQMFDPQVLAEHLKPEQLAALNEILSVMERIGMGGAAAGALSENMSKGGDE